MTPAQVDRREVFMFTAAEAGLDQAIETLFTMGVEWARENLNTIQRSQGQLHRRKLLQIATELGTTCEALWNDVRHPETAQKRHLAAWLLRRRHRLSYPAIARTMHRDHSTSIASVRRVEASPELLAWGQMLLAKLSLKEAA